MAVYYAILTNTGLAKVATAQSGGAQVNITHFAVGDSNGAYYEPAATATALANEKWRSTVNRVYVHPNNANWIVVEALVPASSGGFDIREAGVFDSVGAMIAIGKYPLTNKPAPGSGSEKDLYVRMILQVTNAAGVTQTIDPTLIMATQEYVDARMPHAVRIATTANITLSGLTAIDGVTPIADDRVLVKSQTTASQNGIYLAKVGAWVRSTDSDGALDVTACMLVSVAEGTVNADTIWMLSNNAPITVGTTSLTFIKVFPDESTRTLSDASAPTGETGTPTTLFGWLANMIKAITGKASWRTAPATTLETANTHHGRTDNPHATTAAQVGASPTGHNHTGTYEPANANIQTHVAANAPHAGHVNHSLAVAANDFLVASGVGVWVKKTVAEVRAILGLGSSAYLNTGTTNGTVATGDHGHANNANIGGPFSLSGHGHANDANIGGPYQSAATAINTGNIAAQSVANAVSAGNADILDGQHGAFYQNASNMLSGNLPVLRNTLGAVIRRVMLINSTQSTFTPFYPLDDTEPLISEGTEVFAATVTANSAASTLNLHGVIATATSNAGVHVLVNVYKDSALIGTFISSLVTSGEVQGRATAFDISVVAGDTLAHTYSVRIGASGNTSTLLNGSTSYYGNAVKSSFYIDEVLA